MDFVDDWALGRGAASFITSHPTSKQRERLGDVTSLAHSWLTMMLRREGSLPFSLSDNKLDLIRFG